MPLDPAYVGRTFPATVPYRVSREKIREFAAAIGETAAACVDPAAARALGYRDVVVPPTFAVVVTFPATRQAVADPGLGLDYGRVVHGQQRFVHSRAIVAGDELTVAVTIDGIRAAGPHQLVTTRSDVTTAAGERVCVAYSTLVERGDRDTAPSPPGTAAPAADPLSTSVTLSRADLVRYAGASGDFNPIHWSDRAAKEAGLPEVIAHGMLSMAVAARAATDWAGDPGAVEEIRARFARPVPVPDDGTGVRLASSVTVAERLPDGRVRVDLRLRAGGADVLTAASAVLRPPAAGR